MGGNKWKYDKYIFEPIWETLCILGIYAISDDENALVKDNFGGKLNDVIIEIGNAREILIAGVFNSRTGKK